MGAAQSVVLYESPKKEKWSGGRREGGGAEAAAAAAAVGCLDCVNRRKMKVDKEIEKEREEQLDMYIYAKASAADAIPNGGGEDDLNSLAPASPLASGESQPTHRAADDEDDGDSGGGGGAPVSRKTSRQEHEASNEDAADAADADADAALGSKKARRSVKFDGEGAYSGLPTDADADDGAGAFGSGPSLYSLGLRSNSSLNRKSTPFPFAAGSKKRVGSRVSIGYDDEDFDIDERFPLTDNEGLTDNIVSMELGESEFGDDEMDDGDDGRAMRLGSSSSFGSIKNRKLTPFPRQLLSRPRSRGDRHAILKEEEEEEAGGGDAGYDPIESILLKVTGGSFSERVGDAGAPAPGMVAIEEEADADAGAPADLAVSVGQGKSFTRNFTSLKSMLSSGGSSSSGSSPRSPTSPSGA